MISFFCKEWVSVAESDHPESAMANVLSGILYRFRVVGCWEDGTVTKPSEPSDPFVIDLPGTRHIIIIGI